MKVVFRNKLNPAWHDAIAELALDLPEAELIFDPAEAKRQTPEADVLVGGVFEPDELEQAGALKAVIVPFAGVNKLPLRLLARKKVRVANSHGNASTVAERGLAMILAFYTRLIPFHNDLAEGVWRGHRGKLAGTLDDTWDSIRDKTCCLVGLGAIGFELSKLLAAFGCRILAWRKRTGRPKPEWVEQVSADLDWVLSQSDIVCLTLALTPETKGLFSREWLMNMHNKFLLNVSRADLVDEKGLYDSLDQGGLKRGGSGCVVSVSGRRLRHGRALQVSDSQTAQCGALAPCLRIQPVLG